MMMLTVEILDSAWAGMGADSGTDASFPFLRVFRNPKDIRRKVAALAKRRINGDQEGFYLIHHSDVIEIADKLEHLVTCPNVIIFSGASAGVHEGVIPRSRIERNIHDFLEYISRGDLSSARGVFLGSNEVSQIDRIRVWLDRAQHDYVNLLAPLDLLALAFVGGEIPESEYLVTRDRLFETLNQRTRAYLDWGAENLRGLSRVFEEAIQVFRSTDPYKKYHPTLLPSEQRMHAQLKARLLHLDDEINRGWDLVMPLLFGSDYESFSDPMRLIDRIGDLQDCGERFVVLLDLRLRNGEFAMTGAADGLGVLESIRSRHRAVPVYAFTACNDYPSINATIEAGGSGYIWKVSRALEARPDRDLIASVRNQFLETRFDIFRSSLYEAFWFLSEGLKDGSVPPPFEDSYDRLWKVRRKNLLFALQQILDCDFRRLSRDRNYSETALRNLTLALYRPFEREDAAGLDRENPSTRPNWKLNVLKIYRNLSAHRGRGDVSVSLDIRDAMIVGLLLSDQETLDTALPTAFGDHIFRAVTYLMIHRNPTAITDLWSEARRKVLSHREFLLDKLQRAMPEQIHGHLANTDRLLFQLIADKILRPRWVEQAACRGGDESRPGVELKPLEVGPTPTRVSATTAIREIPISVPARRRQKGLDYFFRDVAGCKVIAFGQRYRDVVLDLSDLAQRDFFSWYYEKNVLPYRDSFTDEALAFFDNHLGGSTGNRTTDPASHTTPSPRGSDGDGNSHEPDRKEGDEASPDGERESVGGETRKSASVQFGISLYQILDPTIGDFVTTAKSQMRAALGPDGQSLHKHGVHIQWSHVNDTPERYSLGVTARERRCFGSDRCFIQLSPSVVMTDKRNGVFLKSAVAQSVVSKAAGHVPWLSTSQASATEFNGCGRLTLGVDGMDQRQFVSRLGVSLRGKSVAVVKGASTVSDHAVVDWTAGLERTGIVRIERLENADAVIVIIPENSPTELLRNVASMFSGQSRPWKVVSPSSRYKDWNVLTGLATRFGIKTAPLFPIRQRDEGTFFLGLDVGHRSEGGSVLAATLFNANGQLVCWGDNVNQHPHGQRHGERIDETTLKRTLEQLLYYALENLDSIPQRLVVHRDGRTLEHVERIVEWLDREFGITRVDWLDIDKQRAPVFNLKADDGTGHYVLYEDVSGRREMWLRTSTETNGILSRPLCILPWVTDVDIESLALEVFDLAHVAAQDYGRKNRLPVTTYFADGFCATGEKQVRFWGYEHLKATAN